MSLTNESISSLLPPELSLISSTKIASLWSNYGYIYRLYVSSPGPNPQTRSSKPPNTSTLILKSIHPPSSLETSYQTSESNTRKLLSYAIERWFYAHLSAHLPPSVKIAQSYTPRSDAEHTLLLEDLNVEFPFPARGSLGKEGAECVIRWLGGFHHAFYRLHLEGDKVPVVLPPLEWVKGQKSSGNRSVDAIEGVWKRGTYWYLDTRREELEEMLENGGYDWFVPWVEKVNDAIERETSTYGTLLHGDVKGANILFNRDPYLQVRPSDSSRRKPAPPKCDNDKAAEDKEPLRCALYDLQYVGIGLPTHDLVYFLGTSVQSSLLKTEQDERDLLKLWFDAFHSHSLSSSVHVPPSLPKHMHTSQASRESGLGEHFERPREVNSDTGTSTGTDAGAGIEYDFTALWRHWELSILDWYRFMAGWGFWGNDRWVERRAKEIVGSGRVERLVDFSD